MTGQLLSGKRLLVTGALTERSLASEVVRTARAAGAEVLLSSPLCRGWSVTSRLAPRLGVTGRVLELDVTRPDDLLALEAAVRSAGWDRVDGLVHAIAYLPEGSAGLTATPWPVVAETLQTAAWSLAGITHALGELLVDGSSLVALSLDSARAWPGHDWLGVARAALEASTRYLAAELGPRGVRVNVVTTGPHRTLLSRALEATPVEDGFAARAPLGWDPDDATAVGRAVVALLSDWFPATTGSLVQVDGGAHAVAVPGLGSGP